MGQRELTEPERLTLEIAVQQLRRGRRRRGLCAEWFEVDSALALVAFLRPAEHEVDAYCVAIMTALMEAGKSEEVMAALNKVLCRGGSVRLVPMDADAILN